MNRAKKGVRGTIVITGASSGLGEEMARQFAALGYDLGLCARRTDRLESLSAEIRSNHPERRVELKALDVTDDDAVFRVFREFAGEFGRVDRFVVNAGVGLLASLGTGEYAANKQTALTNFMGALAQIEAAMEIFRAQQTGHLVVMSSMTAFRGMPAPMTTYGATKVAIASLAEGLQADGMKSEGIDVSILHPGYIASEITDSMDIAKPFMVDTQKGVRAIVRAIEKRKKRAIVPAFPWVAASWGLKYAPLPLIRRMSVGSGPH